MPTEKIRERLPKGRSLETRLMDNVLATDKHLQMGPITASATTPRFDPAQPAGRKADLETRGA